MKDKFAAIILYAAVIICMFGCAKKTVQPKEDTNIAVRDKIVNMKENEVFDVLKKDLGIDFSQYVEEADGVTENGKFFTVRLGIAEGKEKDAETAIEDLCGKGSNANKRKRPVVKGRIGEIFNKSELVSVYDYMRQGDNGAKTKTTEIYTSKVDGREHIFIFGIISPEQESPEPAKNVPVAGTKSMLNNGRKKIYIVIPKIFTDIQGGNIHENTLVWMQSAKSEDDSYSVSYQMYGLSLEEEYGIIESMFKEMSENPKFDETVTGIQKTGQTVNGYACKWIKTDYMVDGTKKSMIQCAVASKDNTYSVCVLFNVSGEEAVERMDDVFSDILYGIDFDD